MTFLDESENFWGQAEKPEKPKEPKFIDGRPILHKYKCPLCGAIDGCSVRKKNKAGYPVLFCETNNKWVECIYKYY